MSLIQSNIIRAISASIYLRGHSIHTEMFSVCCLHVWIVVFVCVWYVALKPCVANFAMKLSNTTFSYRHIQIKHINETFSVWFFSVPIDYVACARAFALFHFQQPSTNVCDAILLLPFLLSFSTINVL